MSTQAQPNGVVDHTRSRLPTPIKNAVAGMARMLVWGLKSRNSFVDPKQLHLQIELIKLVATNEPNVNVPEAKMVFFDTIAEEQARKFIGLSLDNASLGDVEQSQLEKASDAFRKLYDIILELNISDSPAPQPVAAAQTETAV